MTSVQGVDDDFFSASESRIGEELVRAETRGLRRALRVLTVMVVSLFLILGAGLILYLEARQDDAAARAVAEQASLERDAAVEQLRADAATLRAELVAINEQRVAEGLAPVPIPPAPTIDDRTGQVDTEALVDLVTTRVLAEIRPPLSAEQIGGIVAGQVQAAVSSIPVPQEGEAGQDGTGIASILAEGCDILVRLTSGAVVRVGPLCGPPGPGPTQEQLAQAAADYFAANPPPTCPEGTTAETLTVDTDQGTSQIIACVLPPP